MPLQGVSAPSEKEYRHDHVPIDMNRDDAGSTSFIYGCYGDRASTVGASRTGYAGQRIERELGSYLLGIRPYVPWLRHFASPDSISPFGAGGVNRYAYCSGDPVNRIDPGGHAWTGWLGFIREVASSIGTAIGSIVAATPHAFHVRLSGMQDAASLVRERPGDALVRPGKSVHVFGRRQEFSITAHAGKAPEGLADVMNHLPDSRNVQAFPGMPKLRRVHPRWYEIPNGAGGVNYAADTRLNRNDIDALFESRIRNEGSGLPIVVLSGAHGNPHGVNWDKGTRLKPDKELYDEDLGLADGRAKLAGREARDVEVVDIGSMTSGKFIEQTRRRAHIVHTACFGAADRKMIEEYYGYLQPMTTFNLVPASDFGLWPPV